jgi:hypothetical protein
MAQKRSEMRRVKEVLRLRLAFGLSHKAISAACRMPRAMVRDYCQRAKAAGIDSFAAVEPLSGACLIQGGERGRFAMPVPLRTDFDASNFVRLPDERGADHRRGASWLWRRPTTGPRAVLSRVGV